MLTFFQIYCYAVNGLAIFCNGLLLLLSTHKSIETIQELRYFLSNISIAGVIYATCLLLLQPQMVTRSSMTIRVPLGPAAYLTDYHCKLLASTAVVFYMYGMLSFPLFFVYRTMILINSSSWGQYFQKKNLLFTFVIIFLGCCVEGSFFYYSNIPYADVLERLNRTTNVSLVLNEPRQTTVAASRYTSIQSYSNMTGGEDAVKYTIPVFGDDYTKNPLVLYFHGICAVLHGVSYFIILVSAHFMLKTLKRKQNSMSRDTFLANQILVHAVFAESFLPLLLAAPVAANALLTYFYESSLEWQEFLPAYCISLVPLLSPIVSIIFIQPYRLTMKYIFTLQFLRKSPPAAEDGKSVNDI